MNGAQDLGGMMGFGPVVEEADEPWFHDEWEKRAFALTLAMGATGSWTLDASRHARESLPPANYLSWSYFHIWFEALLKLMQAAELVTETECRTGDIEEPPKPVARKLLAADVAGVLKQGGPANRDQTAPARFKVGDEVTTKNIHPDGHTRLARYLRGHKGIITQVHGVHVFPDDNAHGRGENPQWLYNVRFSARELWGDDHRDTDYVHADLWEPYFE